MLYHVLKQFPSSEMEAGGTKNSHLSLENLHNGTNSFEPTSSHDDFLEQMLSSLPNSPWPDLSNSSSNPNPKATTKSPWDPPLPHLNGDSSPMAAAKSFLLQQQLLLPLVGDGSSFKASPQGADGAVQGLFNGFSPPLQPQQPFQAGAMAAQTFGGQGPAMSQPPASASTGGSGGQAPQRQRVRARRGQATDPHSIAERLRRERIAERMKALQELVPNGNKTDKASMLDEIIDYVKFLQVQVKVLSMSRLGGAGAAPRIADLSSEGGTGGSIGRTSNGNPGIGSSTDGMSVTEHQVVKLMEEDMGSAMQYLQGKGLCLMPISLATAISTATSQPRNNGSLHNNNHRQQHQSNDGVNTGNNPMPLLHGNGGEGSSTPNLSALTVQSANLVNGDGSVKDSNPASKA